MPRPISLPSSTEWIELGPERAVRLQRILGKGTGSVVWRGELEAPNGMRRAVAVKLFGAVASDEANHVHASIFESARRAAAVRHPNVVEVYEVGLHAQQAFLVAELVEGVTLSALTAQTERRLPLDLALFIASEVCEALSGARTARGPDGVQLGMCHLGLTQKEILLSWRGEVKVGDFELTTARGATSSIRSLQALAARATMMAPEIAQGLDGDARSDVFSLGVLLRELFVGPRFPIGLRHADAVRLARHGYLEPYTFQPHLPPYLVAVIQRALEVQPRDRFPNASAMAFELRRVALAMGVGDGRLFLRRALGRTFGNDTAEVTTERGAPTPTPPPLAIAEEPMPVSASEFFVEE